MAELPDQLGRERHVDLQERHVAPWGRRAALTVLLAFVLLGLLNVFGQRASDSSASGSAASLQVRVPSALRSGDIYQLRAVINAHRRIGQPTLVLSGGWFDGITVNAIEPNPQSEFADRGDLLLSWSPIRSGARFVAYLEFQANPTTVADRRLNVELRDGDQPLVAVHRSLRIWP